MADDLDLARGNGTNGLTIVRIAKDNNCILLILWNFNGLDLPELTPAASDADSAFAALWTSWPP
jgi:hypothetical protein